jgi:hypothetical protein
MPALSDIPSGESLAVGARFSESLSMLAGAKASTFMRKGVYRFKSHEEANAHQLDCLTLGMTLVALERRV